MAISLPHRLSQIDPISEPSRSSAKPGAMKDRTQDEDDLGSVLNRSTNILLTGADLRVVEDDHSFGRSSKDVTSQQPRRGDPETVANEPRGAGHDPEGPFNGERDEQRRTVDPTITDLNVSNHGDHSFGRSSTDDTSQQSTRGEPETVANEPHGVGHGPEGPFNGERDEQLRAADPAITEDVSRHDDSRDIRHRRVRNHEPERPSIDNVSHREFPILDNPGTLENESPDVEIQQARITEDTSWYQLIKVSLDYVIDNGSPRKQLLEASKPEAGAACARVVEMFRDDFNSKMTEGGIFATLKISILGSSYTIPQQLSIRPDLATVTLSVSFIFDLGTIVLAMESKRLIKGRYRPYELKSLIERTPGPTFLAIVFGLPAIFMLISTVLFLVAAGTCRDNLIRSSWSKDSCYFAASFATIFATLYLTLHGLGFRRVAPVPGNHVHDNNLEVGLQDGMEEYSPS